MNRSDVRPPTRPPVHRQPRVVVYTTRVCPYCVAAKRLLDQLGIPYEERDVSDPAARREVVARTQWRTVPVVLIDDKLVGGFQELHAAYRRGLLSALQDEDA